jgi:hypothetical protein
VLMRLYERIVRRFKIRGNLGGPIGPENLRACVQGDALSMILCNVMSIAWFTLQAQGLRMSEEVWRELQESHDHFLVYSLADETVQLAIRPTSEDPEQATHTGGYADDLHVASRSTVQVQRAHFITIVWAVALAMKLNALKSQAFGVVLLQVGLETIEDVEVFKLLGNVVDAGGGTTEVEGGRSDEVYRRLARVGRLPGSKDDRVRYVSTAVMPVLFGAETAEFPYEVMRDMRVAVWKALRGGKDIARTESISVANSLLQRTSSRPAPIY